MTTQGIMLLCFVLGIVVGGGGWYASRPNMWGWGLVPLLAAAIFLLMLVGAVRL